MTIEVKNEIFEILYAKGDNKKITIFIPVSTPLNGGLLTYSHLGTIPTI
jgi:hypothetical protein